MKVDRYPAVAPDVRLYTLGPPTISSNKAVIVSMMNFIDFHRYLVVLAIRLNREASTHDRYQ